MSFQEWSLQVRIGTLQVWIGHFRSGQVWASHVKVNEDMSGGIRTGYNRAFYFR